MSSTQNEKERLAIIRQVDALIKKKRPIYSAPCPKNVAVKCEFCGRISHVYFPTPITGDPPKIHCHLKCHDQHMKLEGLKREAEQTRLKVEKQKDQLNALLCQKSAEIDSSGQAQLPD